jgi:general secretion pathway protein B
MLIINGQLFHEREQPAPGVVLEQIRLKSAVLGFKGYRFELSY